MTKTYFVAQVPRLLEARSLCATIDGVHALVSFRLSMDRGEIVAVLGPAGAGKTVLLDVLSGLRPASSGILQFAGRCLHNRPPAQIARGGVVLCFQFPRLLDARSALENVLLGLHNHLGRGGGWLATILRTPGFFAARDRAIRQAMQWLEMVGLADRADTPAGQLDLPQRRRLELARALATRPSILLLDEPAAGLDPAGVNDLAVLLASIRERFNIGICFTDVSPDLALAIADQVIVLDQGHITTIGAPADLRQDPAFMRAFGREPEEA